MSGSIKDIQFFDNDPYSMYFVSSNGRIMILDKRMNKVEQVCSNRGEIASFSINNQTNSFGASLQKGHLWFYSRDGKPIIKFNESQYKGALIASHKTKDISSFVCKNGEIYTFQLVNNL